MRQPANRILSYFVAACALTAPTVQAQDAGTATATGNVAEAAKPIAPGIVPAFDAAGLTSLKIAETDVLSDGQVKLQHLRFGAGTSDRPAEGGEFEPTSVKFDSIKLRSALQFKWDSITCDYKSLADKLEVAIEVSNTGTAPLSVVYVSPLRVRFPSQPISREWLDRSSPIREFSGDPAALVANWSTGQFAICTDDESADKPTVFGFMPDGDQYAVSVHFQGAPLPPKKFWKALLTLRGSADDTAPYALVSDVLTRFAKTNPYTLKWDDRRAIATAFLATSQDHPANNPRGWFGKHIPDTVTETGKASFQASMMKYADAVVENSKKLNAQGVIVWDIEGQQMPHPTSYLGDPRVLPREAPEMNEIADAFFKKFSDAGLRTGLTLRPTRVVPDGDGWKHEGVSDPVAEMNNKIKYARKRWGCTLYYVDSNVVIRQLGEGKVDYPAMPPKDLERLARMNPDVLLIPEQETSRYWASTAPYNEYPQAYTGTPPMVRVIYPKAFSVIRVVDGPPLEDKWAEIVSNVKAGDVLLFRA